MNLGYKIIACDFDGTLCENAWPEIGEVKEDVVWHMKKHQAEGDKIILWTCRTGELLDAAVKWCEDQGLIFDAINENLPEIIETMGGDTRKIYADEYVDDKNRTLIDMRVEWVWETQDISTLFTRTYDVPAWEIREVLDPRPECNIINGLIYPPRKDEEMQEIVDEVKRNFEDWIHKKFMESY